jgi:uncharacterized protein (DUF427 family)
MSTSHLEANPIVITPSGVEYIVRAGERELARTRAALLLDEPGHDTRVYFPRDDVDFAALEPHDTITTCSLKGVASEYWALATDPVAPVAWSYPSPIPHVQLIRGYVSFYTDRVELVSAR